MARLDLGYPDFVNDVAQVLGYSRDATKWTDAEALENDRMVQEGYHSFLYPVPPHDWSFLKPTVTFNMWADVAVDSDVTVTGGAFDGTYTTVTATDDTFYDTMVGKSIVITGRASFVIYSHTSATVIVVLGNASAAAADTFAISSEGAINLADVHGGFEGKWSFEPNEGQPISVVGEGQIRSLRRATATGRPRYLGIRPRTFDSKAPQRFEVMAWPEPNTNYVMSYKQIMLPDKLTTANPYPVGGAAHARTVQAACRARAELQADGPGDYEEAFQKALIASITHDAEANTPESLGYIHGSRRAPSRVGVGESPVTVGGVLY